MQADDVIRQLGLVPHPEEGGYYTETWRSPHGFGPEAGFATACAGTAIYYLMTLSARSRMHRLPGVEIFHHYAGDAVEMLLIDADGVGQVRILGDDLASGALPQIVVAGGTWQGSVVVPGGRHGWSLLGCTMAPGFAFEDYGQGDVEALVAAYPDWEAALRARG